MNDDPRSPARDSTDAESTADALPAAKVFGLGLSKTGTSSLGAALNQLGIRTIHYPHDAGTLAALQDERYKLPLLDRFQAIVDISVAPFYKEFDEVWPGSRFILTVREKSSWLSSIERHWPLMHEWARQSPRFDRFSRFIVERVYGSWDLDVKLLARAYDEHVAAVRHYYRKRPNDLLVLDVCAGEGWETLCPFLKLRVPDIPFPHSNPTGSKEAGTRWICQLERARSELSSVIPSGERVVLVDNSELAGCGFEDEFTACPLIHRDGIDWGPPADSAEALVALAQHQQQGARYLVVVWPAYWWLDVYHEFNESLRERFGCLLENSRLTVFDLTSDSGNSASAHD